MPTSKGSGKVFVKGVITEVFDSENEIRIIDFGVGRGTYSNLLKPAFPQSHWTGVEAYKPYVEKYNLEKKYSELIIGDMLDLDFAQQSFDIAFAGDVLEHCTKTEAIEFINRLCPVARLIVVSLPLGYRPQGVVEQNPFEIHKKDNWIHEEALLAFERCFLSYVEDETGIYFLSNDSSHERNRVIHSSFAVKKVLAQPGRLEIVQSGTFVKFLRLLVGRVEYHLKRFAKSSLKCAIDLGSALRRKGRSGIQLIVFAPIFMIYRDSVRLCPLCATSEVEQSQSMRWRLFTLKLVHCPFCGLVRQAPRLSQRGLELYYQLLYRFRKSPLEEEALFERGQRRGSYILDFVRPDNSGEQLKTIVEIGCGYGGILDRFRTVSANVLGYDIDEKACLFAQQKGLAVKQGGIDAIKEDEVDIFLCSHVLEHVPDPVRFLSIVARKLSVTGQIYIEVPGIENPRVIENNLGVQPAHLIYFTRKTLIACCEKAHLDVVKINDKIQAIAVPRDRALPNLTYMRDAS